MRLPQSWEEFLAHPLDRPPHAQTLQRALECYRSATVYPPQEQIFTAFALTAPSALRVVILGQDPYHEPGQAHGLAFSVPRGTPLPPSLRNIFAELENELGIRRSRGELSDWAAQGVLLLNSVLTVEAGQANSHRALGWQAFTDDVLAALGALPQPIVFVLWGAQAQKKLPLLGSEHPRLILQSPHPSPLSAYRGFFGSRPFSKINLFLTEHGQEAIDWSEH